MRSPAKGWASLCFGKSRLLCYLSAMMSQRTPGTVVTVPIPGSRQGAFREIAGEAGGKEFNTFCDELGNRP